MATGWRELTDGRRATQMNVRNEHTAQRQFVFDPRKSTDDGVTLPVEFEPFPGKPWLLCLNIDEQVLDQMHDVFIYTCDYAPLPFDLQGTYEGSEPRTIDTALKGITIGGELFAYRSDGQTIVWEDGGQPVPKEVKLTQRIITGQIRVETETTDFDGYNAQVATRVGKVNSNTFLGFKPEHVLFSGARLDPNRRLNDLGTAYVLYWKVSLSFAFRVIPEPGGATVGWQHHWNPAGPGWSRTTPLTYQSSNSFEQLV